MDKASALNGLDSLVFPFLSFRQNKTRIMEHYCLPAHAH